MALLTADDVLNKTFQSVKFREGYDQIEVDEFLDEVVATIYALTVENAELKDKLASADQRIQELQSGSAPAEAPTEVVEAVVEAQPAPAEPPVIEEVAVESTAPAQFAAEPVTDPQAAASMLALAQRLHDEYVNDGKEEGDRIVAEAHQQANSIVDEAKSKRDEIVADLKTQKDELEDSINNLRSFEQDYRNSISEHLQKLLGDLQADS